MINLLNNTGLNTIPKGQKVYERSYINHFPKAIENFEKVISEKEEDHSKNIKQG